MILVLIVLPLSNMAQREDALVSTEKEGLRPSHDQGVASLGEALVSDVGWVWGWLLCSQCKGDRQKGSQVGGSCLPPPATPSSVLLG